MSQNVPRAEKRRKSPSTLRRDKERQKEFLLRKDLSRSWQPTTTATSTPAFKNQNQSDGDNVLEEEKETENSLEYQDESENDNVLEKHSHKEDKERGLVKRLSKEDKEWFENMLDRTIDKNMDKHGHGQIEILPNETKEEDHDNNDNMEEVKLWAMKQKQSFKGS